MASTLTDDVPLRHALGMVLDTDHAVAIIADREALGVPLTLGDAEVVARWCDAYADPNAAAEALIANGYRGCRLPRPEPARKVRRSAPEQPSTEIPPGHIVRADEPAAFAKACDLAGWDWKRDWKAATFPDDIAHRARLLVSAPQFRVVK